MPDKPSPVRTSKEQTNVVLTWQAPQSHGFDITDYQVVIRKQDGVYSSIIDYCDGSDESVIIATQCSVPMAVLREEPFSLE